MKKNLIAVLALGMFSINSYAQQDPYPKITALQNDPQKWQLVQGIYNVIVSATITSKLSEDEVMKKLDKVIPILLEKSSSSARQDIDIMDMLDAKVRDGVMTRARANQLYDEYKIRANPSCISINQLFNCISSTINTAVYYVKRLILFHCWNSNSAF